MAPRINRSLSIGLLWQAMLACALFCCVDSSLEGEPSTLIYYEADDEENGTLADATISLDCFGTVLGGTVTDGFLVQVTDGDGEPIAADNFVQLTPTAGTIVAASTGGGHTDDAGQVEFSLNAPTVFAETELTITAAIADSTGTEVVSASCALSVVSDALRLVSPGSGSLLNYGERHEVTFELLVEGLDTDCSTGGGVVARLVGPSGAGVAANLTDEVSSRLCITVEDAESGQFYIDGGSGGGAAVLSLTVDTEELEVDLDLGGEPAALVLKAAASTVGTDGVTDLTVAVYDDQGWEVSGVPVVLSLTRCATSPCGDRETVTPELVTTGSDGQASAAYFAPSEAGGALVGASVDDHGLATSVAIAVE